jgi:hypothetical protein
MTSGEVAGGRVPVFVPPGRLSRVVGRWAGGKYRGVREGSHVG